MKIVAPIVHLSNRWNNSGGSYLLLIIGSELTPPISKSKHQPFAQLFLFQTGSKTEIVLQK